MCAEDDVREYVAAKLRLAKAQARSIAVASTEVKNAALAHMADMLWTQRDAILAANQLDVAEVRARGQTESRIDRLQLSTSRIEQMVDGIRQVIHLPDPIGQIKASFARPNGLFVEKVSVPLGVIVMIYESRPNVTVDAAALCLKTGNVAVLRGGREALRSNQAIVSALRCGLEAASLPTAAIQLIERTEHETVDYLIGARGLVDLAIPRGGAALIQRVVERARVPVVETGVGNCHVYVDKAADLEMASRIVLNAKTERPSVCNAAETLLVHEAVASDFLFTALGRLEDAGVELRVCRKTEQLLRLYGKRAYTLATDSDYETEFLALTLAVKVVESIDEAVDHIDRYGTKHSEVIVTEDAEAAACFLCQVDAAAVYHNASSRFTDGFEFGFGAEIGISTQKLHARGPMGLPELTSYKYQVHGTGQVRG